MNAWDAIKAESFLPGHAEAGAQCRLGFARTNADRLGTSALIYGLVHSAQKTTCMFRSIMQHIQKDTHLLLRLLLGTPIGDDHVVPDPCSGQPEAARWQALKFEFDGCLLAVLLQQSPGRLGLWWGRLRSACMAELDLNMCRMASSGKVSLAELARGAWGDPSAVLA